MTDDAASAAAHLTSALAFVLRQAQALVAAHDIGPRLAERIELAHAIARELANLRDIDDQVERRDQTQ